MKNTKNLFYTCSTNKKCVSFQLFSHKKWIKRKFELLNFGGWSKLQNFFAKSQQREILSDDIVNFRI